VRLHVLIEENKPLDATSLVEAIRAGHCFIGFDFLSDSSGFVFEAENPGERKIQGDEISLGTDTKLQIRSPIPASVTVFKDGAVLFGQDGMTSREIPVKNRGVYRAEIYLPQLGNLPWIISNPIYVK
jgi:hypothetical protein